MISHAQNTTALQPNVTVIQPLLVTKQMTFCSLQCKPLARSTEESTVNNNMYVCVYIYIYIYILIRLRKMTGTFGCNAAKLQCSEGELLVM